jgi:RNA polymerase sigma factor (sigma-70 family)
MDTTTSDEPPPSPAPADLTGWRQAVADGSYRDFRCEDIVAAIQALTPATDKQVVHALARHLSKTMLRILRKLVGTHHPNRGQDIIDRVHSQMWEALLKPDSADGKGLRAAFIPRLRFRIKDAIAAEGASCDRRVGNNKNDGRAPQPTNTAVFDTRAADDQIQALHESIDVENILGKIADPKKRLAFRLHMDGVPAKSKKTDSIAKALGVSDKTVREWINNVTALLSSLPEVQELKSAKGGKP